MSPLQIISVLANVVPVAIEVIKLVESVIPGDGEGEKKLKLVRTTLEKITGLPGNPLVKLVNFLVATLNDTGWDE